MSEDHTILLVDDDQEVRAMCKTVLRTSGHWVIEASSGEEAKGILASGQPISLLITDYHMPGMSGVALVKHALVQRPDLPALLISGDHGVIRVPPNDLLEAGCGFLGKPFTVSDFARQVSSLRNTAGGQG